MVVALIGVLRFVVHGLPAECRSKKMLVGFVLDRPFCDLGVGLFAAKSLGPLMGTSSLSVVLVTL